MSKSSAPSATRPPLSPVSVAALHDGLAAHNPRPLCSTLYIPLMVILSTLAMALVLWVGVAGQEPAGVSGPLTGHAHGLCPALAALFCADYMSLGNE